MTSVIYRMRLDNTYIYMTGIIGGDWWYSVDNCVSPSYVFPQTHIRGNTYTICRNIWSKHICMDLCSPFTYMCMYVCSLAYMYMDRSFPWITFTIIKHTISCIEYTQTSVWQRCYEESNYRT